MEIKLLEINGSPIAEVVSDTIIISSTRDALDIMANCGYQGADGIVLHQKNILPDFFDLKTGIAGEILQKFSNYKIKLAIVGDFSSYTSKSLKDFICESNKGRSVCFVNSVEQAKEILSKR